MSERGASDIERTVLIQALQVKRFHRATRLTEQGQRAPRTKGCEAAFKGRLADRVEHHVALLSVRNFVDALGKVAFVIADHVPRAGAFRENFFFSC